MKEYLKKQLKIINNKVNIIEINGVNYIFLTDLVRYKNYNAPVYVITKWMSNKCSFDYYCLW